MNPIEFGFSTGKAIIIFALMIFTSCIFEPTSVYENPVNTNPTAPQITNLELNVNADTLWVYGNQKLKYHFQSSTEKQAILGLKIYIDGKIRDSVISDNGEFEILQSALSEGKHRMNILLFTKSGTGSIADKINGETMLLNKEWVVMADYSNKDVTYTIENGYLKLQWEKYKNPDLESYKIQYSGETKNNYYVDSSYYGAKRTFEITVQKTNGEILKWGSLVMNQNIPQPELKITASNTYYFTWKKSPYYKSIKYRYEFHNTDDGSPSYGDYGYKKGDDTVYVGKLQFSENFYIILTTLPKNLAEYTNEHLSYPNTRLSQYAGEPTNMKENSAFTSADTLTAFDSKNVYKYFLGGQIASVEPIFPGISSGFAPTQISPRGKYLLGTVFASGTTGTKYFAKNLTTGKVYYMNYIEPGSYELNFDLSMHISDNGIGIFQLPTKEMLFDFKNNVEIASRPLSAPQSNLYLFKISPDGKHVISSVYSGSVVADVFRINASNLEKMYNVDATYTDWQFNPTDPNMITSVKNKTLSVIQCEPYALLRKIQFDSDEVFMNIDYFNNEILSINANQFIIRSFNSGNVIKRITRGTQKYYQFEEFFLHNHHIIKNGVMMTIR